MIFNIKQTVYVFECQHERSSEPPLNKQKTPRHTIFDVAFCGILV